jgi:hypothetical protein
VSAGPWQATLRKGFAAVALVLSLAGPAAAQTPSWSFNAGSVEPIEIPEWLDADSLRDALSFEPGSGEVLHGLFADLNGDGVDDIVLRFSLDVCGTNCQFEIIDGVTRRSLGLVGGSMVFVGDRSINGYPIIYQYGHSSADAGTWSTLVHDGRKYVDVGYVRLGRDGLEWLSEQLTDVPRGPPGATNVEPK